MAFSENLNYPVHTVRNEKPLNTDDSRAIKSILSYSAPEIGLQGPEAAERTLRWFCRNDGQNRSDLGELLCGDHFQKAIVQYFNYFCSCFDFFFAACVALNWLNRRWSAWSRSLSRSKYLAIWERHYNFLPKRDVRLVESQVKGVKKWREQL